MTLRSVLLASGFVAAAVLPVAAQDTPSAETVVATVDGVEITLGQMILTRASLPEQYQQLPDEVLWDGILEQLIQQTALAEASDAEDSVRVRTALANERRSILAAEEVQKITVGAVTPEAIDALYQERFVEADQGMEYNAAHILLETEEDAKSVLKALQDGADFAELAKERSTGPSGPNGGALGWFGTGRMVPEFEAAVVALEPGTFSDPVQTQFGWHVVMLNESRPIEAPEIDAVRAQLEGELQQMAIRARIDELVAAATVTRTSKEDIDTSLLGQIELLEP